MIDWVGQQVCRYGANVRYFDTRSLARILTVGDWDDKTRVQEDINKIQQADLVVIDGFFEQDIARAEGEESKDFYRRRRDTTGLVSAPDWLANHVYNILKDRVDRKLGSSIVISNTPPHMIAPKYGPQLITLIKMQCKNTTLEFQDVYDGIYALGEGGLFDD
jgi:hypothetical protein